MNVKQLFEEDAGGELTKLIYWEQFNQLNFIKFYTSFLNSTFYVNLILVIHLNLNFFVDLRFQFCHW